MRQTKQTTTLHLQVGNIRPDPNQPRKAFDEQFIAGLAASIKANGVVQPITVRHHPNDAEAFIIVAGENRWRAHQLQGMPSTIECIVRTDLEDPAKRSALQIIENMQRADLTPAEVINGVIALGSIVTKPDGKPDLDAIGTQLGKSKTWVSRHLKVARMAPAIRQLINAGTITDVDLADTLDILGQEFPIALDHCVGRLQGKNTQMGWPYNSSKFQTITRHSARLLLQTLRDDADHRAANKKQAQQQAADRAKQHADRGAAPHTTGTSAGISSQAIDKLLASEPTNDAEQAEQLKAELAARQQAADALRQQAAPILAALNNVVDDFIAAITNGSIGRKRKSAGRFLTGVAAKKEPGAAA